MGNLCKIICKLLSLASREEGESFSIEVEEVTVHVQHPDEVPSKESHSNDESDQKVRTTDIATIRQLLQANNISDSLLDSLAPVVTRLGRVQELTTNEEIESSGMILVLDGQVKQVGKRNRLAMQHSIVGLENLLDVSGKPTRVSATQNALTLTLSREDIQTINQEVPALKDRRQYIDQVPFFNSLDETHKNCLATSALIERNTRKVSFQTDNLAFVVSGKVAVFKEGKRHRELSNWEFIPNLSDSEHTLKARSKLDVLRLNREVLESRLGGTAQAIYCRHQLMQALITDIYFSLLSEELRFSTIKAGVPHCFEPGQAIVEAETPKRDGMIVLIAGTLLIGAKERSAPYCLNMKYIFLDSGECYTLPIIAKTDSVAAIYTHEVICSVPEEQLIEKRPLVTSIQQLKKVLFFQHFPKADLLRLAQIAKPRSFPRKKMLMKRGKPCKYFYVLLKGRVVLKKEREVIRILTRNQIFWEMTLTSGLPSTVDAITEEPVECLAFKVKQFKAAIDYGVVEELTRRAHLRDDGIRLEDLCPIVQLGQGCFGKVVLCVHAGTHFKYAVKIVNIPEKPDKRLKELLESEKEILLQLDHPMIMKLVKVIPAHNRLCFLTEHVPGISLKELMTSVRQFSEDDTRFYGACIALMLEYLHDHGVVYRDLKPHNIVLGELGYPKLVDFGTAKVIAHRTNSTVGTPLYMAPEVIKGEEYTMQADMWSYGVVLYELAFGTVPFDTPNDELRPLWNKIIEGKFEFPVEPQTSPELKDLILNLLNTKAFLRSSAKNAGLRKHPWFKTINWVRIM